MIRVATALLLLVLAGLSPAHAQLACPDSFSARGACTPITASATGSTGAITATLPATAGKTTFICGFDFAATNATAANTATSITVTGTVSGTLNFAYPTLAAAATVPNTPPVHKEFAPCIAASGISTAIAVNGPAMGTGATLATVSAWGFQQ